MCEFFDYEVTKLERVRIMNISLKGLPVGEWRDLGPKELAGLFDMIRDSSSEVSPDNRSETKKPAVKRPSKKPGASPSGPRGKGAKTGQPGRPGKPTGKHGKPSRPGKPSKPGKPGKPRKPRQSSVKR